MATKLSLQGQGMIKHTAANITVSALAAGAEEDITISDSDAEVGDVVVASPVNAMAETGFAIVCAWVSANGSIKVRLSNVSGSSLTGGTNSLKYAIISNRSV